MLQAETPQTGFQTDAAPTSVRVPQQRQTDMRQFSRVKVNLLGRYMLRDRREFPCQIINMSPGGAAVIAPTSGEVGEKVIVYVDHVGRCEGKIARLIDGGFAMTIEASTRKRDKMAAQLTWLANKDLLQLAEDRDHDRVVPDIRHSQIILPDGRKYNCKLIDISLSGAALSIDVRPAIGTGVTLGRMRAQVTRHFEDGIAVEFSSVQEMISVVQQNLRGE